MLTNVLEFLAVTGSSHPHNVAVSDEHSVLDFSGLCRDSYQLSTKLYACAGAASLPIPVFIEKSVDALVGLTAVLMSGNCYSPLDVQTPVARLKSILATLEATFVISTPKHSGKLIECGLREDQILLVSESRGVCSMSVPEIFDNVFSRVAHVLDADPAYVIFTSGSTGVPKGVAVSHRSIVDYTTWAIDEFGFTEHDILGNQAPLYFDNSILDIYPCFATGAALHFVPEMLFAFPIKLIEHLEQRKVTSIFWVPSALVNVANMQALTGERLPLVNRVLFCGEIMPAKQLSYWMRALPRPVYANLYGPTEITDACTFYRVPKDFAEDEVPIGIPCRNTEILILNEQNGRCVEAEVGEICVRGTSLALGYWNNPEKTAEVFQQNPLHRRFNDAIYRTGDLGYRRSDGNIMVLGRKDNQIKHRGYRIELGDIESAAQQFEYVGLCCATYNTDLQEIYLFVSFIGDQNAQTLRRDLSAVLPKYMVPTRYEVLEDLPRNANGKIDRKFLNDQCKANE